MRFWLAMNAKLNAKSKGGKTLFLHFFSLPKEHTLNHSRSLEHCQIRLKNASFPYAPRENASAHSSFRSPLSLQMVTNVYIHYARHEVLEKSIPYKDVVVFSTPLRGWWVVGGSVGAAVEQTWKVLGFFFILSVFFSTFYTFGCYYTIFALGVANSVLGAFAENYPVSSIELVFSTRTDSRWNETNTTNTDHTRSPMGYT